MYLNMLGTDYRTASLTLREKVSVRPEKLAEALSALKQCLDSGVLLSTCNRTEIYWASDSPDHERVLDFVADYFRIPPAEFAPSLSVLSEQEAVMHLFRTAAGLDSLIVGEYEVLGQVGRALDAAEQAGTVDLPLRQLFQSAIRAGRRVREETLISRNALSVSSVGAAGSRPRPRVA